MTSQRRLKNEISSEPLGTLTEEQLDIPIVFMRAQAIRLALIQTKLITYQHYIQFAKACLPNFIPIPKPGQGTSRQDQLQATHCEGENL
jgi:hypothetical protein